jgi:hypothetical protein
LSKLPWSFSDVEQQLPSTGLLNLERPFCLRFFERADETVHLEGRKRVEEVKSSSCRSRLRQRGIHDADFDRIDGADVLQELPPGDTHMEGQMYPLRDDGQLVQSISIWWAQTCTGEPPA